MRPRARFLVLPWALSCALFCALFLMPGPAWAADLTAIWTTSDGAVIQVCARDDTHVRMDVDKDSYMLLTGDKVYMLSRDQGQWSAMDMDQVSAMAGMTGNAAGVPDSDGMSATFKDLGRTETVADYKGKVYEVEVRDNGSVVQREEMVMSLDPDVVRVNRAWTVLSAKMVQAMGGDSQTPAIVARDGDVHGLGGLLRYGEDMQLSSIRKASRDEAWYELPKGVRMVDMGRPAGAGPGSDTETGTIKDLKDGVGGLVKGLFK